MAIMLTFSTITINIALSSDSLIETEDVNLHEETTEQFDNHSRDNYHVSWRWIGQYNIQLMSDSEVRDTISLQFPPLSIFIYYTRLFLVTNIKPIFEGNVL